jgi:hypothetical protein
MTQKECAIAIRDAVLAWLPQCGHPGEISGIRVTKAELGNFLVIFRTPFSPPPQPKPHTYVTAVLSQRAKNLGYGLDVFAGRKVLNIEWEHGDHEICLIGLRAGEWESEILALVRGAK